MKKQNGITLIALVISIIVMLILAGVSINAVVGDNGVIGKAQETLYLQSCAVLEEFLQMEASNYALEENPYKTQYGMLRAKHPGWFYQNAQGYILDSDGHVMYLIKKSGLPQEIQDQITGGDANKVSQYYKQVDVYGVTSDLQVYYCNNGTDTILGLTTEDLDKDNPLEIAYDEDSLLSKVINGTNAEGKANEALSEQDLKSIKTLTINTTEKLALLDEFIKLPSLQTVYFSGIIIPSLNGIQNAPSITEIRFTNCSVNDYSAMCGLTKLNKLYLIKPTGKNAEITTLCSTDKGIATAEFSNLNYFGIVGSATYIQSTKKDYDSIRYDVTDVSELANLSKTTKEAIQCMYLQNLQLTSIECLSDFINVNIIRLEENALTTFNGIQNMSNLTYLIAPMQYSNATSKYTLGINETENQNASSDALSYIYKDENGKNTSLYYVDIRNANNLKWTSYLATCSGIKYLYMDSNTAIKDSNTIANVIGNCGTNYTIPSNQMLNIISNNIVAANLENQTINISDFEILRNNQNLKYLNIDGITINDSNGIKLTESDLNNTINSVLSTCTNLVGVSLNNISDLNSIEFVKNTPKLFEIHVLNTNVSTGTVDVNSEINGLELLNNYCSNLHILRANNANINLGNLEVCLQRLFDFASGMSYWGGSLAKYSFYTNSKYVYKTLENAKNLTNISLWNSMKWGDITVDLSDFSKLKKFSWGWGSQSKFILPESVEEVKVDQISVNLDLSNCTSLKTLAFSCSSNNYVVNTIHTLPSNIILDYLHVRTCGYNGYTNFETLTQNFENVTIKSFSFGDELSGDHYWNKDITSLEGLEKIKGMETITLRQLSSLEDISALEQCSDLKNIVLQSCENIRKYDVLSNRNNLENLTIKNCKLKDIEFLRNNVNLTLLDLYNNGINDIKPLENLKKLESLNLQNNALYDSSYDKNGKAYYTLTVFSDLNQKQDGSLKNLYLGGNNIEDFSMLQDSNLKWDDKSGW